MEATLRVVEQPGQKLKFRQVAHSHKCQSAELLIGRVSCRLKKTTLLLELFFINSMLTRKMARFMSAVGQQWSLSAINLTIIHL